MSGRQVWRVGRGTKLQLKLLAGRVLKEPFLPCPVPAIPRTGKGHLGPLTCAWALRGYGWAAAKRDGSVVAMAAVPFELNGTVVPPGAVGRAPPGPFVMAQVTKCRALRVRRDAAQALMLDLPITGVWVNKSGGDYTTAAAVVGAEWVCTSCWKRFRTLPELHRHTNGDLPLTHYAPVAATKPQALTYATPSGYVSPPPPLAEVAARLAFSDELDRRAPWRPLNMTKRQWVLRMLGRQKLPRGRFRPESFFVEEMVRQRRTVASIIDRRRSYEDITGYL